ncbi:Adenylate kinase [Giardia duodenalis]|uniref:Adenylate kinase n=1 Tax=Giardia intestinalis TaxID=5741 RepID=V6TBK1_GIAIN|nr:Adenylate kinase [Giardia intestinalis]
MRIVHFLGVPGAGKSTVIGRFCQEYPLCASLYIGQIVREEIQRQTPLGQEMQLMLAQGNVLSGDAVIPILQQEIAHHEATGTAVLFVDGFPRSDDQARAYLLHFGSPTLTLCLSASDEVIAERLMTRQQSTTLRLDDTKDIIQRRIEKAREHVQPGLDVYIEHNCKVEIIDSSGYLDEVCSSVLKVLHKHKVL